MKATLRDIAEAASVSVSTASRALSGHPAISEACVGRVREVAQHLNYSRRERRRTPTPDRVLEGKTVAIVSLGMHRSLLALPAVSNSINGAEEDLALSGARVMLAHFPDLEGDARALLEDDLAGVILASTSVGEMIGTCRNPLLTRLRQLPAVWMHARPSGCWGNMVGSNDYLAGQRAAEYLIARGHRRLAFLNPKPEHVVFQRREDGFVSRARRLGAEVRSFCEAPPEGWPLPDRSSLGTRAVDVLVAQLLEVKPRPTAVLAAADSLAVAVYRALADRGLTVGKDLSVISVNNDEPLTAGLYPSLTTFDVHAGQIGQMAVRQLVQEIAQPTCCTESELLLAPTLVERESVARLS